jgi:hypothetical protein
MTALLALLNILNAALAVIPEGTALYAQFQAQKAQADQWAADGHIPSDEEWSALDALAAAKEKQIDDLTRP